MGKSVLQIVVKGLLGRLLGYGLLALGFWLLYRGFQTGDAGTGVPLGVAGGIFILIGMYFMVTIGRRDPPVASNGLGKEDSTGDPIDRSN